MSWFTSLWRNRVHRERVERDLDDELRAAFELLVEEKLEAGMRAKDARRAALIELGGIESIKEQVRAVRAGTLIDSLFRDVRHGVRVLVRGRLFTAIAVLTLALGIGANSAIFTLVNGLLLRPLPYPDVVVDRLVWIATGSTTSIGVRIALGASRRAIVANVLARASVLIVLGLIAGSAMALALTRVLESNLYGVTPTDPATFAGASLGLASVSLFAAYLAARRAAGIQPTEALRAE